MAGGTPSDIHDRDETTGARGGEREWTSPVGIAQPAEWIEWDHGPANAVAWLFAIWFAGLCGLLALRWGSGRPEWVVGWRIAAAFLVFAMVLFVARFLATGGEDEPRWLMPVQLGLGGVLLWAVYRSGDSALPFGFGELPDMVLVVYVLFGFVALADDPRTYTPTQWFVLVCFAVFITIFFGHAHSVSLASPLSFHPLWGGVLFGLWLVVLPRHLPAELVLWAFARVAAVTIILGMVVYVIGPYTLWGLEFRFHNSFTLIGIDYEVPAMRSFFINRNSFAILTLAGFVSALIEYLRAAEAGRSALGMLVPSVLVVVTGVGYLLAYGRWLWTLGVIPLLMYFAYQDIGRVTIPAVAVGGVVYFFAGIAAIHLAWEAGLLDDLPTRRHLLWQASVLAIQDNFSLVGEGLISTAEFIGPYWEGGQTPHNAYFVTWIRFGVLGGLAYLGIVLTGIVHGMRHYRTVDIAMFALVVTFALHQMVEGHTMYDWLIGSAIATLPLGFVLFGEWQRQDIDSDEETDVNSA